MSNNKFKILIVEDDKNIRSLLSTVLSTEGYQALSADSCVMGTTMFVSHIPDLVILDLGLPDGDGMTLLREIRSQSATPIIILSARSGEDDKVAALDLGANDYITKPFGSAELLARVRAALRNHRLRSQGGEDGRSFSLGDLSIDYDRRRVQIGAEEIKLTQTEYNILALLCDHSGKVLTYSAIIKAIWGCSDDGNVKKLQVNMANIRKKLGSRPGQNQYILNELGIGYRINDDF